MADPRSNAGLKVAASGVSLFSGSLLLAVGLGVVWLGRCSSGFGHDVVEHDSGYGGGTVFGKLVELGGDGVAWLGGVLALSGVVVLLAALGFFASLFKRKPPPQPPPAA